MPRRYTQNHPRRNATAPHSRLSAVELIRLCGNSADIVGRTANCPGDRVSQPAMTPAGQVWRTVCPSGWCSVVPRLGPMILRSLLF